MNPLEEALFSLLQQHKEKHGINALDYLEAFYAFSRVMTFVFEGKREDLMNVLGEMKAAGKSESELFSQFTNYLIVYQHQYNKLNQIQGDIEKTMNFQRGSNGLERLIQSERGNS